MLELLHESFLTPWLSQPITWVLFVAGLILGSFYNVCIWRLPEGNFWRSARSKCRGCQTVIPFFYNVPILSWLYLRGRAKCCGIKLSIQYPLVELLTGIGIVIIYIKFPFIGLWDGQYHVDPAELMRFLHASIFFSVLLIASVIDLRHMIIPDQLSLGLVLTSPLVVWLMPGFTWQDSLIGVLAGGGILYFIAWIYWVLRKSAGMGMGDVKLLAGIGGWIGWQSIFPIILYSSILGSVTGITIMLIRGQKDLRFQIPFGPFLAMGALLQLYFSGELIEKLLNLIKV